MSKDLLQAAIAGALNRSESVEKARQKGLLPRGGSKKLADKFDRRMKLRDRLQAASNDLSDNIENRSSYGNVGGLRSAARLIRDSADTVVGNLTPRSLGRNPVAGSKYTYTEPLLRDLGNASEYLRFRADNNPPRTKR